MTPHEHCINEFTKTLYKFSPRLYPNLLWELQLTWFCRAYAVNIAQRSWGYRGE